MYPRIRRLHLRRLSKSARTPTQCLSRRCRMRQCCQPSPILEKAAQTKRATCHQYKKSPRKWTLLTPCNPKFATKSCRLARLQVALHQRVQDRQGLVDEVANICTTGQTHLAHRATLATSLRNSRWAQRQSDKVTKACRYAQSRRIPPHQIPGTVRPRSAKKS